MKITKGKLKICSRGHKFYKSSDCPVCPICWSGYYKKRAKKGKDDFPKNLAAPALRALLNAKITTLKQVAKFTEVEISELHGMGPKALGQLKEAVRARGVTFAKPNKEKKKRE